MPLRAMQRRALGAFATALVVAAGVVACAPDISTSALPGSGMKSPTGASRNVTPATERVLKVCTGDGPAGTYTYQLSNIVLGTDSRGTVTTPLGTSFSVPSGTCVDAAVLTFPYIDAETDVPSAITVTQVARPAGANFKYIQDTELELQSPSDVCLAPANFPCGQDTQVFVPTTTAVINEYHGSVLAFFHNSGSLGDFVWADTNGNGIQDAGEPGIAGQTVTLSGTVSGTTVTGANGEYAFTGLPAGTYTVTVATPAATTPSPVNAAGSTPSNDSNGSGTTVTLAAGEANPTIDFGFVPNRPTTSCVAITAVQGVAITPVTLVGTGGSGGPYTFTASALPAGLTMSATGTISGTPSVSGTFAYSVTVTDKDGHTGTLNCSVKVTPPSVGGFTTYTQGGWGAVPKGNNPGQVLTKNFSIVYPANTVKIGGTRTLTFTSAGAITNFLPQGSTPGTLAASATNPTTSAAGVFAGQVLSLRLSVDFSAAGVTKGGLGALRITSGKLAGTTVSNALALANAVIGGNLAALPAGVSVSDLNGIIDNINNNFDGGTSNNGYLAP